MDTINRVWTGEAGLARTYWLFGVIGSFVWGLLIGGIKPGSILAIVAVVLFLAYIVMVNVGTWRAASQYEGPRAWAILAKMAVAAIPVLMVVGVIAAIVIPATSGTNEKAPAEYKQQGAADKATPRYYTDEEVGFAPKR